jgi:hypothetical protein
MLQPDVFPFDVAEVFEPLQQCPKIWLLLFGAAGVPKHTDRRNPAHLLCARSKRPNDGRTAERGNELPPSDVDCHSPSPH